MNDRRDIDFLNHIFQWLCEKLNKLYGSYMETNDLVSKYSLELPVPVDVCRDLRHVMQLNHIGDNEILRIDIQTPLLSIRAKCLFNKETHESFINMIDFALNKIQLRSGGFGSKVIDTIFDCHQYWIAEQYNITNIKTEMAVFKYLSIPFWLKKEFSFKWMGDMESEDTNHWNVTYKFFKLLILMNEIQDLNQSINNFELFSLEPSKIDDMLRQQIPAYHHRLYNSNLWIKANILDHVGSRCCEDFVTDNFNFCTKVIYKNIINQLANDKLSEKIIPILWELFYLTKTIGR